MKKILLNIFLLSAITFVACEKEEEKVTFDPANAKAATLSASANSVTLSSADDAKEALTFTLKAADYGYNAGVTYTLQIDKKGNDFKNANNVALANALTKSFTVKELNKLIVERLGATPGVTSNFEARIKSDISDNITSLYSNVVSFSVIPYLIKITYPELYVPGSYQGWDPASAERIASSNYDEKYEGFINFPDAGTKFKFTPLPNWSADWGDDGTKTGKLKAKATDIEVKDAGYYQIKADTIALTYSVVKTDWGLIGDATAGGWDKDENMTYDATKKVWTITTTLKGGKTIKFRANDAWDINFGDGFSKDSISPDGVCDYNGDNIPVGEDGSYTITLNLSSPGNYSYSLKKN